VKAAAAAVILGLAGQAAAAQPASFAEAMHEALAEGGAATPWLRCAGLFRAFRLLAGRETELGAQALEAELDLAVVSAVLREDETGAAPGTAMEEIVPLIGAAAELYLDRMVDNEAGAASVMDDGLRASLEVCATLRAEATAPPDEDAP
jgi:hypothetical protein